jgi:hypothetical protein
LAKGRGVKYNPDVVLTRLQRIDIKKEIEPGAQWKIDRLPGPGTDLADGKSSTAITGNTGQFPRMDFGMNFIFAFSP